MKAPLTNNQSGSDITVVIITKNEGYTIESVVKSWVNHFRVLVIDSHSWDGTVETAERSGAKTISQSWLGYGAQKQFGIESAETDWVLSIDADEWPSDLLVEELRSIDLSDITVGYTIRRKTFFLGKMVRFSGWGNDRVLRLFNRRFSRFDGREVHEKVLHAGPVRPLRGSLYHYSYTSSHDVFRKTARYARLSSQISISSRDTRRVRVKKILGPIYSVIKTLILQGGILDGPTGFKIAAMKAKTVSRKYQLIERALNS